MSTRRPKPKSRTLHTLMGPITVSGPIYESTLLQQAAIDAARIGRGHERPWFVDERGRPVEAAPPYLDLLSPLSLQAVAAQGSPVAKTQAAGFELLIWKLCEVDAQLDEIPVGGTSAIVDPVVRYLVVRELKALLGRLAPLADPTGALQEAVERVANDLPGSDRGA